MFKTRRADKMIETIGVVGLGLIGGSFAKCVSFKAKKTVYGFDINKEVLEKAISEKAVSKKLTEENLSDCDAVFVCLYPRDTVDFIKKNISHFKKGTIISDICGVKGFVSKNVESLCRENNLTYIGTHPMAGKEVGGYQNSETALFSGASVIIAGGEKEERAEEVKNLLLEMGFGKVTFTDEDNHDRIIALTSQLAHIVSSSYVKSETAKNFDGFSAGSFGDMTRVAKLNPKMWTELFMANKTHLVTEINSIIDRLTEYKSALETENENELFRLLYDGNKIKEELLKYEQR